MRDGPLGRILVATRDIKPLGKDLLILDINLIKNLLGLCYYSLLELMHYNIKIYYNMPYKM